MKLSSETDQRRGQGQLVPQFPHLPVFAIFGALLVFNLLFVSFGLRQFRRKAVL